MCLTSILVFIQIRTSLKLEYHKSTISHDDLIAELNDETVKRGLSKYISNTTTTSPSTTKSSTTSTSKNDIKFSACLIVKDENHNLPEWLAYHYTMTNLEYLIVCLDPYAKTSPLPIFSKWEKKMSIEVWNHKRYYNPEGKKNKKSLEGLEGRDAILATHRARQRDCYSKCMRRLKNKGMTWTMLIDVDEYLTFNPVSDDDSTSIYTKINNNLQKPTYEFKMKNPTMSRSEIMKDQGLRISFKKDAMSEIRKLQDEVRNQKYPRAYEKKKLKEIGSRLRREHKKKLEELLHSKITAEERRLMKMRLLVPNDMNVSIPVFLRERVLDRYNPYHNTTCIALPRLQFGSIKSKPSHLAPLQNIVHNLTTLQFFHHYQKGSNLNRAGKCIVDVSRLQRFEVKNPHNINIECSHGIASFPEHYTSFFRVNHYSSTKEIYLAQDGVTRIDKHFDRKSNASHSATYEMQGWLDKFVDVVGEEEAMKFLDGAGRIAN